MSKQKSRYHLSMAGEYLVAAQLQRLELMSSVTYGNAKSADVIAFNSTSDKATVIEVKTSSKGKWPIGSRVPDPSNKLWVFVHLPESVIETPEFFILTQEDIHNELKPEQDLYFKNYKEKHGVEYGDKPGVAALKIKHAEKYKDKWSTIVDSIAN